MKKHRKCKKIIIAFVTVLFIAFVAVIGLHKTGIYRFDFLKDIYKKIDFQLSTNELNIPQDALSFSVYDIEQEEYLFYEGDSQLPTVASLAKLFAIDYALGKVDLEDIVEVNQEVLELVPAGSSLANLYAGEYTVKQIMEAMLVPSGNDAAYVLAYHIAKNELGEGYTATEYIDYFMTELSEYLIEAGYSKTNLYNDPSGASMQADSHLDDINRVALKLLNYDFVKECIGKSEFSIQTPQGEFTWKNTNEFLYTKMRNVAGLSTSDAQKSSDMFAKCRYMDEITGNRGVIFATGTPVSNSMTELYTMQRYLQYERLQELNMTHFDCWASRFGETVTALELAPEGTGYRARTRFSKFFNLPELMNLFKEVADIKTADQLNLPTPEVEYHNIVAQPTEHQQEMVKALSERASLVHSGTVDPSQDNMLKITSDGRKLGLDQRIVNQMLPDEPGTKVNQCVDNIMQIWRDGKADKLTQLVFCDISTPQAKAPASKAAKTLDNPLLHALEGSVPLPEKEPVFTVYDDIRQKLIAQGMPADQIAFIHEANTEVRKKELFSKVRTGQVRVLLGSTAKMGAGTNVQDRLVALHDLDCPWRPGDLAQRKGRIERQGNQNPLVHVYRYVTEGTFDAYLWQTVENKQKFISQIMTSKSPVRSCDDVDETALSFAEIKALCAGDPRIKERMDLDVEVSRLKLMKADHQSKQYRLEDQLLKYFPEEIEKHKGFIKGFESDLEVLTAHPHPEDGFAGMEIRGDLLTDKENAGAALLDACKEVKTSDPVQIGSYRGYAISVEFSAWKQEYTLLLKGQMTHRATLGTDPRGNLTRIDNALAQMPQRLEAAKAQLDNLYQQQAAAKEEVGKPFLYEEELRSKNARLVELDTLLNIDGKGQAHAEAVVAKSTRTSVLDSLKRPVTPRSTDKKPKQHEEVR